VLRKKIVWMVALPLTAFLGTRVAAGTGKGVHLVPIGTYAQGIFDQGAAEIVAHDPQRQQLFVVNAQAATVDVLDIQDPTEPIKFHTLAMSPFGGVANSIAVDDGVIAVAVENANRQLPGKVVLFNRDFDVLSVVEVGAVPDMLTFSPNGRFLLVANEGEPSPDYSVDPEGSVSIIDMDDCGRRSITQANVRTVDFRSFTRAQIDPGIRIFGPNNPTVAQDLEPEYIAISNDSKTAWVTLQENNAIAIIDIKSAKVKTLVALGAKDHSVAGNGLDPSDSDGGANIGNWPVRGLYMPDAVASFTHLGENFLLLANEGDAREYTGFVEAKRVKTLALDPVAFPNAVALKTDAQLGRLNVTSARGDTDGDGDFDELYAFGTRSFSIRRADGSLVFDSGDQLEQLVKGALPYAFNANHGSNTLDNRSDDKGPEPEGVAVGKAYGMTLGFIGLERVGGIVTYDLSDPFAPRLLDYANFRDFTKNPATETALVGDLGPEGLCFVKADDSPNGRPLLVVGNEVSGSTTIYEVTKIR
jgi:2',3'-cyclic-nucleotide 2'-phosphodiesterase / 3'-nucleotidase / 5'-nucleotidase